MKIHKLKYEVSAVLSLLVLGAQVASGETIAGNTQHMVNKTCQQIGADWPTPNTAAEKVSLNLEYTIGTATLSDLTEGSGVRKRKNCNKADEDGGDATVTISYEKGSQWQVEVMVGGSLEAEAGAWIASAKTTIQGSITGTYGQNTTNSLEYTANLPYGNVPGCKGKQLDWKVTRQIKNFDVTVKSKATYRGMKKTGELTVELPSGGTTKVDLVEEVVKTFTDDCGGLTGGKDMRQVQFNEEATSSTFALQASDCPNPCECFAGGN